MSEKKKFKVGDAVVNVCTMLPAVYEHAVAVSTQALKEEMTEMAAAAAIKKAMLAAFPSDNWQVRPPACMRSFAIGMIHSWCIYAVHRRGGLLL